MLPTPKQNRILAALRGSAYERIRPDLELVSLRLGEVLDNASDAQDYLYFPTTCIISLIAASANDESVATAMTGNDGVVGVAAVLGSEDTLHRLVVQSAGYAYRVRAEIARWEFAQHGELEQMVLG